MYNLPPTVTYQQQGTGDVSRIRTMTAGPRAVTIGLSLAIAAFSVLSSTGCSRPSAAHHRAVTPQAPNWDDTDGDGIPDRAELRSFEDRENFRRWFAGIAETQFYSISAEWSPEQRDCAGLVRFAFREALRRHDRSWFQRMGSAYEVIAPDVRAYTLDTSPLGEKIFRTDFGSFKESDLASGKFSEFADARTLKTFNSVLVGRDRSLARPGDLLFYHQPWVQKYPYHVMIFLGQPRVEPGGASDWVVYHTGASATDGGAIKKVRLAVLDHHPDKRWRPVVSNSNFLGFYRLKILE
jgi:uncharacterized protein YfaT (DUF1175 family)